MENVVSDRGATIFLMLLGYLWGSNLTQFNINIVFTNKHVYITLKNWIQAGSSGT